VTLNGDRPLLATRNVRFTEIALVGMTTRVGLTVSEKPGAGADAARESGACTHSRQVTAQRVPSPRRKRPIAEHLDAISH
jgi:hypothetical protein